MTWLRTRRRAAYHRASKPQLTPCRNTPPLLLIWLPAGSVAAEIELIRGQGDPCDPDQIVTGPQVPDFVQAVDPGQVQFAHEGHSVVGGAGEGPDREWLVG